ncbi:MAG TPA: hypothetical protein PLM07_05960 [Candidatus Rifleibacterium sp.]|nr:hypothetical protein [Candidatus Rifleibacterium sp.]HPT45425.1 hypothetical protein [Candidatus Rifleibacterium sp.]
MRFFVLLLLLTFISMPALACDLNLFAIMAGTSKQDEFAAAITRLAVAIKLLGEQYLDEKLAERRLVEFMSCWVDFAASFSQFPPEWGGKDPRWQAKFSELGRIIGEIRQKLKADRHSAHDEMLKFSRRLSWLYECKPMGEQPRLLLEFTRCFDRLWSASAEKNRADLIEQSAELKRLGERLNKMLANTEIELTKIIGSRAEQLIELSTRENVFESMTLRMTLSAAEAEFASLNEKLSAAMKPTTPGNENSTDH